MIQNIRFIIQSLFIIDNHNNILLLKIGFFWMIQAMWGIICLLPVTLLNSLPLYPSILSHIQPNKYLQIFSTISIIGIETLYTV